MNRFSLTGLVVTTFFLVAPSAASACAVCFAGEEESRVAYILMTGFLTFLPLVMIGFGVYMLRRHILKKQHELREAV
jgi:amino acid transporter